MFRVKRIDDHEFRVEERGFLWLWWNAAYIHTYAGSSPRHFKTIAEAVEWINETKRLREEHRRRQHEKAKNIVVWQDE